MTLNAEAIMKLWSEMLADARRQKPPFGLTNSESFMRHLDAMYEKLARSLNCGQHD